MNIGINFTVECLVCGWSISYKNDPNLEAALKWFRNHVKEQHPADVDDEKVRVFIARYKRP